MKKIVTYFVLALLFLAFLVLINSACTYIRDLCGVIPAAGY